MILKETMQSSVFFCVGATSESNQQKICKIVQKYKNVPICTGVFLVFVSVFFCFCLFGWEEEGKEREWGGVSSSFLICWGRKFGIPIANFESQILDFKLENVRCSNVESRTDFKVPVLPFLPPLPMPPNHLPSNLSKHLWELGGQA